MRAWLCAGEGPVGLIVCPSRELARQTFEVINGYTAALREDGHPELRSLLVMGGVDMKTQARAQLSLDWATSFRVPHNAEHVVVKCRVCSFLKWCHIGVSCDHGFGCTNPTDTGVWCTR